MDYQSGSEKERASRNQQLLSVCNRLIGEKYGKPNLEEWRAGDFAELNSEIFKVTRVQISVNTLKRVFGRLEMDGWYFPQQATRDALAIYIGYKNWSDFANSVDEDTDQPEKGYNDDKRKWFILGASFLVLMILIVLQRNYFANQPEIKIICRNPEGQAPHTALFDVVVKSGRKAFSERYQLLFPNGNVTEISPDKHTYLQFFSTPGVHLNLIKKNGLPIDTLPVLITTKGWVATVHAHSDPSRFFHTSLTKDTGPLQLDERQISKLGVDTTDIYRVRYTYARHTGIDGDNFELTSDIKASRLKPSVRCGQIALIIAGLRYRHGLVIQAPGCENWTFLEVGDKRYHGYKTDLSFLTSDLRNGGKIRLRVKNKKLALYINDKEIFHMKYTASVSEICAVNIEFVGFGVVNSLQLQDLKTSRKFAGNFDH